MKPLLYSSSIFAVAVAGGMSVRMWFKVLGFVGAMYVGWAAHIAVAADADYLRDIRPLLQQRCFACHGALKQDADLRLDTGALIRVGGESGMAVSPGEPDQSLLIERITADDSDERMPPEGEALDSKQVIALRNWIAAGATSPEDEQPEADPQEHWSFQKLIRPNLPNVVASSGPRNQIDSFILYKLQQHDVEPQSVAPKHVLLRRVYLDLIGLPPTSDELHRFLTDNSENAWAKVVARLLNDPRHAERWARHWMDIWRYSDWYGRRSVPDVWNSAPQIWRWRDWIVNSLNEDKGYDRMIVEMLAADEVFPEDRQSGYATGFLIRNWYALNPNDWMRSNVEHTGKAFLGLTFNCAHCHDHKYDPISHDDYFRMRAFFEPLYVRQDRVPGEADPGPFQDYDYSTIRKIQQLGSVRVFDKTPNAPTWFYSGGDERNRQEDRGSIPPGVPAFLECESVAIEPIRLPAIAWYPGLDDDLQQTMLDEARHAIADRESALENVTQAGVKASQTDLDQLIKAEAAYTTELETANREDRLTAVVGKQSLVLDAIQGRRVLQNRLPQVKEFDEGFTVSFHLLLTTDTHFNFQLAKHIDNGLTAALVAFDRGRIVSYQPQSTTEFNVGEYDFAAGQNRFFAQLVLQSGHDQCLLSIRSISDDQMLVANAPIALNGWNPVDDPNTGIFLDAQTGSVAAIDQLIFGNPSHAANVVKFNFELPVYPAARDAIGREGWERSSYCKAPATSVVTTAVKDAKLSKLEQTLDSARRAVQIPELRLQVAQASLVATQAELTSLEDRIAADQAKYGMSPDSDVSGLARIAAKSQLDAAFRKLESDLLRDEYAVVVAGAKPLSDKNREQELASSTKRLVTAQNALAKKRLIQTDTQPETYSPLGPVYPNTSTGRRRALAQWITSRDNPLTARVAINHIWMRHFHAPLVESVYDFGRNGSDPTHPELLDWLAVELIESGWSMKHIHRLIVSSDTYRRSSSQSRLDQPNAIAKIVDRQDGENRLLWRMNTGRMEAEVIRDSLLYCGQLLDSTMKGQSLTNDQAPKTWRRSLYYEVYPEDGGASELSELFDAPSPLDCYRRTRSIVPQQALALSNSDLVHRVSAAIVTAWSVSSEDPADSMLDKRFVTELFEQILTRAPTAVEFQLCLDGLHAQRKILKQKNAKQTLKKARESLVRILLNHNDFVTVR